MSLQASSVYCNPEQTQMCVDADTEGTEKHRFCCPTHGRRVYVTPPQHPLCVFLFFFLLVLSEHFSSHYSSVPPLFAHGWWRWVMGECTVGGAGGVIQPGSTLWVF